MSSPTSELGPHQIQRLVRAGAGAGKTTDLVRRVLDMENHFWVKEKRHCHLVVTTFTRKATQELRERLMAEALDRGQAELIDFVQRPSHLHISTIHGVLSLYLTRFGSEMGLGPEFQILSSQELGKFNKRVFRKLLQSDAKVAEIASEFLESLDLKSLLASLETYYALWCQNLCSPVTSKQLEALFEKELSQAQSHLSELVSWIDREDCSDKWISYRERLQVLDKALDSATAAEKRVLLERFSEAVTAPSRSAKRPSEDLGEFKKQVHAELEGLADTKWSLASFESHDVLCKKFEMLASAYSELSLQHKISSGSLSLSDLELLSYRMALQYPDTAQSFSKEWDYWMIDEYQDTSPLQVRLIELMMGDKKSFIVGDPQQSIYLFRGARTEVFAEKESQVKALPSDQGEALELMKNYRSQPQVLGFINSFFTNASSGQFQPMSVGYNKEVSSLENEAVQYIYAEDSETEVDLALARALELQGKGVASEQICILSRSNEALSQLARKAGELRLPVQVHSSTQFSGRREIQDAVALLKFLVNPFDNITFIQLLRSPWLKVADTLLQKIAGWGEEAYFFKALKLTTGDDNLNWIAVKKLHDLWQISKVKGLTSAWMQGLTELAIFDLSEQLDPSGRREANLWKLVSLVHQAEKLPGFSILQFLEQMTQVQVDSEGDSDATPVIEPRRVNLMTVHASKGLQFQYVILLGLGKKSPSPRSSFFIFDVDSGEWTLSQQDPIERKWVSSPYGQLILKNKAGREQLESERVLYVALTRAILGVTLIWSDFSEKSKSWAHFIPQDVRVAGLALSELPFEEQKLQTGSGEFDSHQFHWQLKTGNLLMSQLSLGRGELAVAEGASLVREKWSSVVDVPPRRLTSVTSLLEKSAEPAQSISQQGQKSSVTSLKSLEKALRGVEIHRMFESLKYQDEFVSAEPALKKAYSFVNQWQSGRILSWIRSGEVEWGFAVQFNNQVLQGQIDLWTTEKNQVLVVDYKTGSQDHLEKAFAQLEIYAWALQKMKKVPKDFFVKLVVVYPLDEAVFERAASPEFMDRF